MSAEQFADAASTIITPIFYDSMSITYVDKKAVLEEIKKQKERQEKKKAEEKKKKKDKNKEKERIAREKKEKEKKEKNIFVVRLQPDAAPLDWWRPGMTGLCKITVEKRTLWWIFTHRTTDFLRLKLWW